MTSLYASSAVYGMLFADRTHDLHHYRALAARHGGPILDVGVGRGRVAIALARDGHRVVGLDDAPAMLEALAARVAAEPVAVQERLAWHLGCARTASLDARFALVLCPFNGVAHHHTDEELDAFLARARVHLAPERGRLAFDALLPTDERLTAERVDIPWLRHPAHGTPCRATEERCYDPETGILTTELSIRFMEEDRPEERHRLALRLHDPAAWEARLDRAGFALEATTDLGDVIAVVARPR